MYLSFKRNDLVKTDKLYSLYPIQYKESQYSFNTRIRNLFYPGKNKGNNSSISSINYLIARLKFRMKVVCYMQPEIVAYFLSAPSMVVN